MKSAPSRIVFVAANPSIDRLHEVDRLTAGSIHRPSLVVAVPGGKGLNAARVAFSLGANVTAVGIVGGRAGDWIAERLAEIGLDARLARTPYETRTCVSILDRTSGELTETYERGEPIVPSAWDELETLLAGELAAGDVGAVALSGSLPLGAPADGFGRLARLAAAQSIPLIADTYGSALAAVLAEHPAIVKLNAAEAAEATELRIRDAESAVAAAEILRERGATNAIVTLGVEGAIVVSATEATRIVPPDARGLFPVGSGDAFLAGLAVAFVGGATVVEAARLGVAAGAANAAMPGAGELDPGSVQRMLEAVSLIAV